MGVQGKIFAIFKVLGLEFGEMVMCRRRRGAKLEELNPRFERGVFVGVRRKSNEVMVADPSGIHFVRDVRRLPKEKRWVKECLTFVRWAPWRRSEDALDGEGEVPEGVEEVDEGVGVERN